MRRHLAVLWGFLSMGRLNGKVAIITGAGRGMGRGMAIVFAREGAKVVVASRTPSSVDEVVNLIKSEGGEAFGVPCDVGHRDELEKLVKATVDKYGTVDVLVNNAQGFNTEANPTGTMPHSPMESITWEEMEYTYRTGVFAALWLMQLCFPYMKAKGKGKVINICSRAGQVGLEFTGPYNSNKEALRAVSRTAAREWGRYGVSVNVINPLLETNSMESLRSRDPDKVATLEAGVPMGRLGDAIRDAGPLAAFLASDESDYVSGQTIMLDGANYTYA